MNFDAQIRKHMLVSGANQQWKLTEFNVLTILLHGSQREDP